MHKETPSDGLENRCPKGLGDSSPSPPAPVKSHTSPSATGRAERGEKTLKRTRVGRSARGAYIEPMATNDALDRLNLDAVLARNLIARVSVFRRSACEPMSGRTYGMGAKGLDL
jgi:hypothetical protein